MPWTFESRYDVTWSQSFPVCLLSASFDPWDAQGPIHQAPQARWRCTDRSGKLLYDRCKRPIIIIPITEFSLEVVKCCKFVCWAKQYIPRYTVLTYLNKRHQIAKLGLTQLGTVQCIHGAKPQDDDPNPSRQCFCGAGASPFKS